MTGKEKLIPRFPHAHLSDLLLQYLVFVRHTEEVLGSYLWGPDASQILHHHLFYHLNGKALKTGAMSRVFEEFTEKHLKVKLNVSTYCHLAAAIGRHLVVGIIDAEEEMTTGMDAMAGRETTTSEAIYGLQPGEVGKINERILSLFRSTARLWHAKVLRLELEGRVVTLDQILHPNTTMDDLAGKRSTGFGQSDLHSLIDHLKAIYEDSVVNKIVPLLMQALEEKMADQFLHGGDTRLEDVDLQDMLPRHEEPQPSVGQKNKGKGRAIVPVSSIELYKGLIVTNSTPKGVRATGCTRYHDGG